MSLVTEETQTGKGPWETLLARLDELARTPVLLVSSDFDGTIAPIVSDPLQAEADRESLAALRALASMPQTHVAVISGRALADLASRTTDSGRLLLVGSHGSEFEPGLILPMSLDAADLLKTLRRELEPLVVSGVVIEEKPASLAFHYRNVHPDQQPAVVDQVLKGPAARSGVYTRHGKMVIELSVVQTSKGEAMQRLRQRVGATAALFMGDDVTDEDAFATLGGPDVGVKIGEGPSTAPHRAPTTTDAARTLAYLAERRREFLAGAAAVPIEQHSLLSDQRTMALMSPDARVVWLCLPRIDSAAFFAELLGGPAAGYFSVAPVPAARPIGARYLGDTMLLRTDWENLSVTDYLDCAGGRAFHRAGRTDLVRVIEGRGRARIEFAPRLDFGRTQTRLRVAENGIEVEGTLDPLVLRSPGVNWELVEQGHHQTAIAEVNLGANPLVLELRYGTASLDPDNLPEPQRRQRTQQHWSAWAATLSLPALQHDLVKRSAILLRSLCYGPSGGIAASATTSLPEHAGGVRNWDYRFCWPRDAAMTASALVELGATGPAIKFLDWMLGILDDVEPGALLRPVYSVSGGHLGAEAEIMELPGYRGSRPVRVGNAAAHQVQLDVFGPIAELMALLARSGAALSSEHGRVMENMVAAVQRRWQEPDHGIWEIRAARRHHVHSKVMCWQTVDRALAVSRYLGRSRPEWVELRRQIAADVLQNGWKEEVNAFSGTYEEVHADAATLAVGLSGLLPPDDPRFLGTLAYVEKHLRAGVGVYRYKHEDGLPGIEGAFLICTTWLIEAYALAGRIDDAMDLFNRYVKLAGPTGLFSEEWDPYLSMALGNVPQAFSHLGLIRTALLLDKHRPDRKSPR